MLTVKYEISLRLWHPSIDPADITKAIGVEPKFKHKVGLPRHAPSGAPLKGVYKESYWCANLVSWCENNSSVIEEDLANLIVRLSPQKEFFSKIQNDGGRITLWISTHSLTNYCIQLPASLMLGLSNIGLSVIIDVYPYPQNW